MFKRGFFMVFTAIVSLACAKENPSEQETQQTASLVVNVSDAAATRATTVQDSQIKATAGSIQVLVFNSSGLLVAFGENQASSTSISLNIPTGAVTCYAYVNGNSRLKDVATESELLQKTAYLKYSSPDRLKMIGKATHTVTGGSNSVTIPVKRFAAKVQIDKITPAFTSPAHRAMEFKLKGIYLINVNGTCPYTQVPTAPSSYSEWYNRQRYNKDYCDDMISDILETPVIMQNSQGQVTTYTTPHYLYCYPNPVTTDSSASNWSERFTRLVVETTLGETTYYYPVNIPSPESNTMYQITNMKITGLGSNSPDKLVEKGSLTVSISITDWSTGFSKEVEY